MSMAEVPGAGDEGAVDFDRELADLIKAESARAEAEFSNDEIRLHVDYLMKQHGVGALIDPLGKKDEGAIDAAVGQLVAQDASEDTSTDVYNRALSAVYSRILAEIFLLSQVVMLRIPPHPGETEGTIDQKEVDRLKGITIANWLATQDYELDSSWGRFLNEAIPGADVTEKALFEYMGQLLEQRAKEKQRDSVDSELWGAAVKLLEGNEVRGATLGYSIFCLWTEINHAKLTKPEIDQKICEIAIEYELPPSEVQTLMEKYGRAAEGIASDLD